MNAAVEATEDVSELEGLAFLKRLDLSDCKNGNQLANMISNNKAFCNLEMINLSRTELDNTGLQLFYNSPFLGKLEVLLLSKNKLTQLPKKSENLKSAKLVNLKVLDVTFNQKLILDRASAKSLSLFNSVMILCWKKDQVFDPEKIETVLNLDQKNNPADQKLNGCYGEHPLVIKKPTAMQMEFVKSL